ncbi:unnamed protein product [Lampetra fluviatilis]
MSSLTCDDEGVKQQQQQQQQEQQRSAAAVANSHASSTNARRFHHTQWHSVAIAKHNGTRQGNLAQRCERPPMGDCDEQSTEQKTLSQRTQFFVFGSLAADSVREGIKTRARRLFRRALSAESEVGSAPPPSRA